MSEERTNLSVEICAIERAPIHLEASEVLVPGEYGLFTVMPEHTPVLSTLDIGVLTVRDPKGDEQFFAINRGFAEVANDRVLILTYTAEMSGEIDEARADQARKRAEDRLESREETVDIDRAELALRRALARIHAREHKYM